MHILLQLISSKAAVFFISDENSGWLPISLLLIISFSFDLDYDSSVRDTHLFISFAWWDGLFWRLHRLMHIKNGFRSKLESCESAHMAVAFFPPPFFLYVCKSSCIFSSLLCKAQTVEAPCILFFSTPPSFGCLCFRQTLCLHCLLNGYQNTHNQYCLLFCSAYICCSWHEISAIDIKQASQRVRKELITYAELTLMNTVAPLFVSEDNIVRSSSVQWTVSWICPDTQD